MIRQNKFATRISYSAKTSFKQDETKYFGKSCQNEIFIVHKFENNQILYQNNIFFYKRVIKWILSPPAGGGQTSLFFVPQVEKKSYHPKWAFWNNQRKIFFELRKVLGVIHKNILFGYLSKKWFSDIGMEFDDLSKFLKIWNYYESMNWFSSKIRIKNPKFHDWNSRKFSSYTFEMVFKWDIYNNFEFFHEFELRNFKYEKFI